MSWRCVILLGFFKRKQVSYHTSVFFSAEPGLSMCICTSFHDYTVCHIISCYHRGIPVSTTQSVVYFTHSFHTHPLWPLRGEHCSEQPLHQICCSLHVYAFACICDMSLQVCQHPNSRMREWGAEALTALIKAGLAYKHDPPLAQNQVTLQVYVMERTKTCFRRLYSLVFAP